MCWPFAVLVRAGFWDRNNCWKQTRRRKKSIKCNLNDKICCCRKKAPPNHRQQEIYVLHNDKHFAQLHSIGSQLQGERSFKLYSNQRDFNWSKFPIVSTNIFAPTLIKRKDFSFLFFARDDSRQTKSLSFSYLLMFSHPPPPPPPRHIPEDFSHVHAMRKVISLKILTTFYSKLRRLIESGLDCSNIQQWFDAKVGKTHKAELIK